MGTIIETALHDACGQLAHAQVPLRCIVLWHLRAGSTRILCKELPILSKPEFSNSNNE